MKLTYLLFIAMTGVAQAKVYATFGKSESLTPTRNDIDPPDYDKGQCLDLQGDKEPINDGRCFKNRGGSESIFFSTVGKSRTVCLIKYAGDDCDKEEYLQNLIFVKEGK
jgi:hypothetical protein